MIKAIELLKVFTTGESKLVALNKLNFEIPSGQFLAITGRSGSGKSTLLYQLSLLDHPTGGQVFVDEEEITMFEGEDRTNYRLNKMGYIFQDYAILPTLTALENVMLPILEQGMDKNTAKKSAIETLGKVGLADKLENLPSQLSGGQQQRVSIARSVAHKPSILFADEPTANLDTVSSKEVLDVFDLLHKEGQTIVMVTHEKEYARVAERIIELSDGEIISDNKVRNKL